ncbi:MAG: winged helix-turn-helix transcriptional regulator [Gammaproteobacteria bacterium]|nr:winged helix-turn-helix transcriptional regulator [Gammaproteobacteria bacterium]
MGQPNSLLERLAVISCVEAARHGLLPIHIQVLHYLSRANRYSDIPIAIAEYFGITRGTVSQTLAVLERKALLIKTPDPRHGKRVHLGLTTAGEAMLNGSWPERIEQALSELPVSATDLDDVLRRILSTLQQLNGQRAFGLCRKCSHFLNESDGARCGLTQEPLATEQTVRICREWTGPGGGPWRLCDSAHPTARINRQIKQRDVVRQGVVAG